MSVTEAEKTQVLTDLQVKLDESKQVEKDLREKLEKVYRMDLVALQPTVKFNMQFSPYLPLWPLA